MSLLEWVDRRARADVGWSRTLVDARLAIVI